MTLRKEAFAPEQIIRDLLAVHAVAAQAKGIALLAEVEQLPAACSGDALRLHQVIDNLLGNAVKFTSKGQVKMSASYAAGELVVVVSDTGAGISHAEQERVFARFERAAASEGKEGVGLGLAITQALVKAMAGQLTLESIVGMGTTFTVHLPMPQVGQPLPAVPAAAPAARATTGLKVLYVEVTRTLIEDLIPFLHRIGLGDQTRSRYILTRPVSSRARVKNRKSALRNCHDFAAIR